MAHYTDRVFAPIDLDHSLERLGGGNETEVYRSDDGRYVVKLKADLGCSAEDAATIAKDMRDAADSFARCLGPRASIPSFYLIAEDSAHRAQVLVIQPLLENARPLAALDYDAMPKDERRSIATQLRDIIARSLRFYGGSGSMPDLYGRASKSHEERKRNNSLAALPERMWSFLVERNLLRSHNLMYTEDGRVVLVDYDVVRRGWLYRKVYFTVRWVLFWRDHLLIHLMRKG